jgi:hypothetical protein
MTINNNLITFSIILFRTEEDYKNNVFYTSSDFFLWDHRTDIVKEIELSGLKGQHMLNLSDEERETLWLDIFKNKLSSLLTEELAESTIINIYLNTIIYNNTLGGRYITKCIISLDNLLNWSEINKAEQEYDETVITEDFKDGRLFMKF